MSCSVRLEQCVTQTRSFASWGLVSSPAMQGPSYLGGLCDEAQPLLPPSPDAASPREMFAGPALMSVARG